MKKETDSKTVLSMVHTIDGLPQVIALKDLFEEGQTLEGKGWFFGLRGKPCSSISRLSTQISK